MDDNLEEQAEVNEDDIIDVEPEDEEVEDTEESDEDTEEDEVTVTIGDTPPPEEDEAEKAPSWVRDLRKAHRESQRRIKQLEQENESLKNPAPKKVELGPKPKLEDFDYDAEEFETALTKWYDDKRAADAEADEAKAEQETQRQAWKARLDAYGESKKKLKVRDFEEAEAVVQEMFDQTQQGIVIQGADDAAIVFYALYKNPDKLDELSKLKDPVKFAFAVAKLEKDMKVGKRKAPPPPEKTVSGTAPKSGTVDSTLERLRAEAERTGNYSKVHEYKQKVRKAKA